MSKLTDTLKDNLVMKELVQYIALEKIDIKDFLLKFKLEWQIGYLLQFLYSKYKATIFVNEKLYIVFIQIEGTTRLVVDKDNRHPDSINETYMDAICDAITYINKPF